MAQLGGAGEMIERRFPAVLLASALFVPALLLLDGDGLPRQLLLGAATALFLALVVRASRVSAPHVAWAVAIATLGECVLSMAWGLYHYRHAALPLYVPPGHGLFYTLAAFTARQELLRRYERAVLPLVAAVALYGLLRHDTWGLFWLAGAGVLLMLTRDRLLLAACFAYTVALEWLGTALGNWRWEAAVPHLGLRCANPPAGVGILYMILDLLVVAAVSAQRVHGTSSMPWRRFA